MQCQSSNNQTLIRNHSNNYAELKVKTMWDPDPKSQLQLTGYRLQ